MFIDCLREIEAFVSAIFFSYIFSALKRGWTLIKRIAGGTTLASVGVYARTQSGKGVNVSAKAHPAVTLPASISNAVACADSAVAADAVVMVEGGVGACDMPATCSKTSGDVSALGYGVRIGKPVEGVRLAEVSETNDRY